MSLVAYDSSEDSGGSDVENDVLVRPIQNNVVTIANNTSQSAPGSVTERGNAVTELQQVQAEDPISDSDSEAESLRKDSHDSLLKGVYTLIGSSKTLNAKEPIKF